MDMIGQRVGQYEITGKLGEGGMGVVWRGRDSRLNRDAAIKVLSGNSEDPQGRQRLLREAQAASALNHPNIVTIYDIGENWVAMEFVPGQSLAQMIEGKPLRSKDAHAYARQIASALAAAHDAGILHRDLKPANIMVTPEGRVKVLDFGLAKHMYDEAPSAQDATVKAALTGKGMLVGTFAYMSPEQTQVKKLDARSDIFSFGAVLYEMVTGRRAFEADSAAATMSAILRDDPPPATEAPVTLQRVIERCLEKSPSKRFQHAADIEWALEQAPSISGASTMVMAPPPRRSMPAWAVGSIALVCGGLLGAGLMMLRQPKLPDLWDMEVLTYSGNVNSAAISPDGNEVAFVWDGEGKQQRDLYVKSIAGGQPRRLTNDAAMESSPAWSADGKRLAFTSTDRRGDGTELHLIAASGGPPRKLVNTGIFRSSSLSWSPDDRFLAAECGRQICTVALSNGETRMVSKPESNVSDHNPVFGSDSKKLAFLRQRAFYNSGVFLLALNADGQASGEEKRLTNDEKNITSLAWEADGKNLIATASLDSLRVALWRVGIGGGELQRISPVDGNYTDVSLPRTGNRLALLERSSSAGLYEIDLTGRNKTPELMRKGAVRDIAITPDGSRIAFISEETGTRELWTAKADGTQALPLTRSKGLRIGSPRWSPDGSQIAFDGGSRDGADIYVIGQEGGTARRLTPEKSADIRPSWSRDGKWIYFCSDRTGRDEVFKVPVAGGTAIQITRNGGNHPMESADGKALFFFRGRGVGKVWKQALAGGEAVEASQATRMSTWALGGRNLYYTGERKRTDIYRVPYAGGTPELVIDLPEELNLSTAGTNLAVSDDESALWFKPTGEASSRVVVVHNFR